jgi:hypothetical protein
MNQANIKEINGKTIESAQIWPDDEGEVALQMVFTDHTTFCLTIPLPKLVFDARFYKDEYAGEGKDLTEKLIKRASK